ncbi:N-acetylcysteine deacetylase-like [Saccostrea echinata]|uniref:N-acetylcysteine deacetylase-like n=1 Tax=Saccostrea echinata TaxID=191078 RepID=UPI002A809F25|nr:N-acetylcysteine deacetylase-like [Saccostrea echinata]
MGTDPIVVGAQVILALQQIVSRNLSAIDEPAVVSVTEVTTNGTVNVIPSSMKIKGDTRSFTDAALQKIEKAMERIVAGQCAAAGVKYQYEFRNTFISTINAEGPAQNAVRAAAAVAGAENVNGNCQPFTISEDFAFLLREKPGCYILIGNGEGRPALHNPHYDFNDAILEQGIRYWKTLVEQQLSV